MTVEQFTGNYGFSDRDSFAAQKMYAGQEKTVEEWHETLKNDFSYTFETEQLSDNTDSEGENKNESRKKK